MPPIVFAVLGAIQAAMAAAPQVRAIAVKGREFIATLTGAGIITQAQQDQVYDRINAISEAHFHGKLPPGWEVEPNP